MKVIAVFGASRSTPDDGTTHWEEAVQLGVGLANAGYAVVTGGYCGLMEAVSQGAKSVGGHVIGVTAPTVFPKRSGPNDHVTEERRANSLVERIHEMTDTASATISLHGSLGTLTELTIAWNLAQLAPLSDGTSKPVVTVGKRWKELVKHVADTVECNRDVVHCVDTVAEALEFVKKAVPL